MEHRYGRRGEAAGDVNYPGLPTARKFATAERVEAKPSPQSVRTLGHFPTMASDLHTFRPEGGEGQFEPWQAGPSGMKLLPDQRSRALARVHAATARGGTGRQPGAPLDSVRLAKERLSRRHGTGGGLKANPEPKQWLSARRVEGAHGIVQPRHAEHVQGEVKAYYDPNVLNPKWNAVTKEPGDKMARVVSGYARKVDDTAVSHNAPAFMQIPEVMRHVPKNALGTEFKAGKLGFDLENKRGSHGTEVEQHRDDTAVSANAPLWFHNQALDAFQEKLSKGEVKAGLNHGGHTRLSVGGQMMFEPNVKWGSPNR